jgi:hypothetical protein
VIFAYVVTAGGRWTLTRYGGRISALPLVGRQWQDLANHILATQNQPAGEWF